MCINSFCKYYGLAIPINILINAKSAILTGITVSGIPTGITISAIPTFLSTNLLYQPFLTISDSLLLSQIHCCVKFWLMPSAIIHC